MPLEPDHDSLRRKFVDVFCTVLPSLGTGESLGLLLSSLEACLSNDAAVFVSGRPECGGAFSAWVFAQLVSVHGQLADGPPRRSATVFGHRLLRTLLARHPRLLAAQPTAVWLGAIQQLTQPGSAVLRMLPETEVLPAAESRLPAAGAERQRFRSGALQFLLSDGVLDAVLMLPTAHLDVAVTALCRLGGTECRGLALAAVNRLTRGRPLSARLRLLIRRLQGTEPVTPDAACQTAMTVTANSTEQAVEAGAAGVRGPPRVITIQSGSDTDALASVSSFAEAAPEHWRQTAMLLVASQPAIQGRTVAAVKIAILILSRIESTGISDFPDIYRCSLEVVVGLLSMALGASSLELLAAVVSLPWLGDEVNWLDLHLAPDQGEVRSQLERVMSRISVPTGDELAEACLRALVRFPRQVCPQWRSKLTQRLLSDCEVSVSLLPSAAVSLSRAAASQMAAQAAWPDAGRLTTSLAQLLCLSAGRASYSQRAAPANADCEDRLHLDVTCAVCDPDRNAQPVAFTEPTIPVDQVCALVLSTLASFSGRVTSEERRVLLRCLNHADERSAVVRAVLSRTDAVDWSPTLRPVLSGGADWRPAQTLLCDWLVELGEEGSARALRCLLHCAGAVCGELVPRLLARLQRLLLSARPPVAASAHLSQRQLCRRLQLTTGELWQRHRRLVCAELADRLLHAGAPLSRLAAPAAAWECRGVSGLLRAGSRHLLPPLIVAMATSGRAELLQSAAAVLKTKPKELLIDNYQYVLSHVVLSGRRSQLGRVHAFVSGATALAMEEIRRCSIQAQVNELVPGLHAHRDAVIRELGCLARLDGGCPGGDDAPVPLERVVQFMSTRLLGVLGWADSRLGSRSTSDEEKRQLLLSLGQLCDLLGSGPVSAVGSKLVATLRAGLTVPSLDQAAVWLPLLRALDAAALRALVAELLVTLEPLPAQQRQPLLHCLLTERHKQLRPVLDELPELPELAAAELQPSQAALPERLDRAARSLRHPSLSVRRHVLLGLRQLLGRRGSDLGHLLAAVESRESVSRLVDALLAACQDADVTTHNLVAECLGALGAVDPARLTTSDTEAATGRSPPPPAITSDEFAVTLLTQLARAFTAAADGVTQACAGFAMQELLKLRGLGVGGAGSALWDSLTPDLRQLLTPMRSSKYHQSAAREQLPASPVYGSEAVTGGHPHWMGLWLAQLASFVHSSQAAPMFACCKPIACRDLSLATLLQPHVFVRAVAEGGSAARAAVLAELQAVLGEQQPAAVSGGLELQRLCCRAVFSALDAAVGWRAARLEACGSSSRQLEQLRTSDAEYRAVTQLLENVPFDLVAGAARRCGAHKRALQSIEIHLRRRPELLSSHLSLLQDLYVSLSEPDGVAGVSATRPETPSVADQLILYRSRGQMHHALSCYERVCNTPGSELDGYRGLISCYLSLDQPNTALCLARDLTARDSTWGEQLGSQLVEATWRLGRWDELEPAMESAPLDSWSAGVGAILLHADQHHTAAFERRLGFCRELEMTPLCAAALERGGYARAYEHLVRLHMVSDLERALPALLWTEAPQPEEEQAAWQRRLEVLQPSVEALEPVLTARRAVLSLASQRLCDRGCRSAADALQLELGRCWLRSARVSRQAGQLQRAANCLLQLQPQESRLPEAFVERASLLWLRAEGDAAIRVLRQGIASHFPDWAALVKSDRLSGHQREILAEAKLLLARYCEESAHMDSNVINQLFVEITEIRKDWEDVHFYTAKYLDRLLGALPAGGRDTSQLGPRVVHALGKSLEYGCRHVYESMPRLLSIWLDYGASELVAKSRSGECSQVSRSVELMCRRVAQLVDKVPLYCFLTSLSQIISRICHGRPEVYAQIRELLATLLATYPKQCMWYMLAVSRSSYPMRVERCQDVFARAKTKKPELAQFIADAAKLADKLIDLSNKPVDKKTARVSLATFFPSLRRLVSAGFSEILVPLQQQMTVTLPEDAGQHGTHFRPFPDAQVCIAAFEDEVDVMTSLVRPKRITLRGTDGNRYTMMAKPKDDLRKDSRLMEFNRLVNRQLARDGEARRRRLHIRTYTVIPLNDECGLLEWVPNLSGLRQVLLTLYRQRGNMMTNAELKQVAPQLDDPLPKKRSIFTETLLARHPPVLSQWFLTAFSEPESWYRSRLNFARTAAVMSMIGYILGLGDRHGENILLDASCGDCVHVDFNCLFNKGELFDWPERVPFRLTHNMVDALGPTGVEGVYRTACEVTMSVMRQQREALMCVLRPFVHDPLVEWSRPDRRAARDVAEIVNERAQAHVGDIEQRLRGQVRSKLKPVPIPLSVSGQVNYLIEEATSLDNLCQMYIGWAAYF